MELKSESCINCFTDYKGNYCPNCGQRSFANRRIQFKEIISDFFDNTFNLHKGFFYTFWKLIVSPAEVGHNYISGKRKTFTNPTRYLVVALAIQAFIDYWLKTPEVLSNQGYFQFPFLSDALNQGMEVWNYRLVIEFLLVSNLSNVFIFPLIFYVLFRRLGHNLAELIAVNFYYISMTIMLNMVIMSIAKSLFGFLIPLPLIILFFASYLSYVYIHFFKAEPIKIRLVKIIFGIFLAFSFRVFLLPLILAYLFPVG